MLPSKAAERYFTQNVRCEGLEAPSGKILYILSLIRRKCSCAAS